MGASVVDRAAEPAQVVGQRGTARWLDPVRSPAPRVNRAGPVRGFRDQSLALQSGDRLVEGSRPEDDLSPGSLLDGELDAVTVPRTLRD